MSESGAGSLSSGASDWGSSNGSVGSTETDLSEGPESQSSTTRSTNGKSTPFTNPNTNAGSGSGLDTSSGDIVNPSSIVPSSEPVTSTQNSESLGRSTDEERKTITDWLSTQDPGDVGSIIQAASFTATNEGSHKGPTVTTDASGHTSINFGPEPIRDGEYSVDLDDGSKAHFVFSRGKPGISETFIPSETAVRNGWKPKLPSDSSIRVRPDISKYFEGVPATTPSQTPTTDSMSSSEPFVISRYTVPLQPVPDSAVSTDGTTPDNIDVIYERLKARKAMAEKFGIKNPST